MSTGCHGLSWGCNSIVLVGKQTYHHPMRWVRGGTRQSILLFLPRQSCPPGFTLVLPLQQPRFPITNPFPFIPGYVTVTVILGLIAHNSIYSWYIFVVLRNARIRHLVYFPSILFLSIIRVILIFLIIVLICHHPQCKFPVTAATKFNFIDRVNVPTLLYLIQLQANIFLLHMCNQLHLSLPPGCWGTSHFSCHSLMTLVGIMGLSTSPTFASKSLQYSSIFMDAKSLSSHNLPAAERAVQRNAPRII